ncbi:hypothetical protein ABT218_29330 [Streptomyces sp. NPDC001455]|uniref:hypothetical protein n=2 Tax=Streptomyces TaxID=1883 RepID=UPI0033283784
MALLGTSLPSRVMRLRGGCARNAAPSSEVIVVVGIPRWRRGPRAGGLVFPFVISLVIVLGPGITPASATFSEGQWLNSGGAARTPSTPAFVSVGSHQYRVVRGEDGRLWASHNNGPATLMPDAQTGVGPEIVAAGGRVVAFHTGTNGYVYYSFLQNTEGTSWTPWTQVPAYADTVNSLQATVVDGLDVVLLVTQRDGSPAMQTMRLWDQSPDFDGSWTRNTNGRFNSAVDITAREIMDSRGNPTLETEIIFEGRGMDNRVWYSAVPLRDFASARFSQLPGDGVCDLTPAIGRGGLPDRFVTDPNDPNFRSQQEFSLACISPDDGNVWINRSTDNGNSWSGWNRTTDGAGPSNASPSIHSDGANIYAALSWNGNRDGRYPDHAIVEKRI